MARRRLHSFGEASIVISRAKLCFRRAWPAILCAIFVLAIFVRVGTERRTAARLAPGGKSGLPSELGKGRIHVSVAASDATHVDHLVIMLSLYLSYDRWDVDVTVDTMDRRLADVLQARLPRANWTRGKSIRVQTWSMEDLQAIRDSVPGELSDPRLSSDSDPIKEPFLPLLLSFVHRTYLHRQLHSYEFFVYTEEDIAMGQEAFELYASRYRELWERGWMFDFYRYEVGPGGVVKLPDQWFTMTDQPVYRSASGHLYAQLHNPYHASWVLDSRQVAQFMEEPVGDQYARGKAGYGVREGIAEGWHFAATTDTRWWPWFKSQFTGRPGVVFENRALVPILPDGRLDPRAGLHHLPNKYALESNFPIQGVDKGLAWGRPVGEYVTPLPART